MREAWRKEPTLSIITNKVIDVREPINLSYVWNLGSLMGMLLVFQMISGVCLSMAYCPQEKFAFLSVAGFSWGGPNGHMLRYFHATGASMFFLCVYLHMGKGLYYGGYRKIWVWYVGVVIYVCMVATAFLGYVLPWGQMSFWAAGVITGFFFVIPYIGEKIAFWVWGWLGVSNATLNGFYGLHYLLPFVLALLVLVHLHFLHKVGSNNSMGLFSDVDKIPFHPFYTVKDLSGNALFFCFFCFIVCFFPYYLGDAENFKEANPLVAPLHIKPEWYFLFMYAILRSIPNKVGGVVALAASIVVWLILPFLYKGRILSLGMYPISRLVFWFMVGDVILLTLIGGWPVEEPYVFVGQLAASFYFIYFLVLFPLLKYIEDKTILDL